MLNDLKYVDLMDNKKNREDFNMGHLLGYRRFSCSLTAVLGALLAAVFVIGPAHAQNYPSRTIRVIVPFLAGSATDVTARLLTNSLAQKLSANIIVENKGGAGGNIGTDYRG